MVESLFTKQVVIGSNPMCRSMNILQPLLKCNHTYDLKKLSKEDIVILAKSMIAPIRCGGCDYDGKHCYYIFGGNRVYKNSTKEPND